MENEIKGGYDSLYKNKTHLYTKKWLQRISSHNKCIACEYMYTDSLKYLQLGKRQHYLIQINKWPVISLWPYDMGKLLSLSM